MKIKRVKTDAQGNAILDQTTGQPVIEEVEMFTPDEVNNEKKKAKTAVEQQLTEAQQARQNLEGQLAERDRRDRERERQQLPVDQQVMVRLSEVESTLAQERAAIAQERAQNQEAVRKVGLVAYRERALRDVPPEVHHMVVLGKSEEEIDASVDLAVAAYEDFAQKMSAKFVAAPGVNGPVHLQQAAPHQPHAQHYGQQAPYYQGQPVPYVQQVQPPANPAYVPPVPQYAQQQGGFPTPTNPLPVPDPSMGPGEVDLSGMTTEQAVRSGRYGGEMRERILGTLKGQARYPGSLGSNPRHWSQQAPAGHVAQPMGVMQPQGYPTGPMQPAHMNPNTYQQPPQQYAPSPQMIAPMPGQQMQAPPQYAPQYEAPPQQYAPQYAPQQYAPPPAPPQGGHRGAAAAAIARTMAGQNPVVAGDAQAQSALQESQQFAQARGIHSPQQAFQARFTPTPPIQPPAN